VFTRVVSDRESVDRSVLIGVSLCVLHSVPSHQQSSRRGTLPQNLVTELGLILQFTE